jgi:intracellular sulfur oxidation DsrE/DsrF family protein
MKINRYLLALLALSLLAAGPVLAGKSHGNVACPVDSPYGDDSFEDKFGDDVLERMRCNKRRSVVKMVMQVNAAFDSQIRMYGFRNLPNIINDLEITHGVKRWEIAVVIHSGGYPFVLDPDATNPHPNAYLNDQVVNAPFPGQGLTGAEVVEKLIGMGVDVYFCLNTAAALNITTDQILPGVQFVPAGLTSIVDFQYDGFKYVQP